MTTSVRGLDDHRVSRADAGRSGPGRTASVGRVGGQSRWAEQNGGVTDPPPFLRVVRGEPTAEELAALVAVLAARGAGGAGGAGAPPRPRSAWADPAARLREPLRPGPSGWRRSALPP